MQSVHDTFLGCCRDLSTATSSLMSTMVTAVLKGMCPGSDWPLAGRVAIRLARQGMTTLGLFCTTRRREGSFWLMRNCLQAGQAGSGPTKRSSAAYGVVPAGGSSSAQQQSGAVR